MTPTQPIVPVVSLLTASPRAERRRSWRLSRRFSLRGAAVVALVCAGVAAACPAAWSANRRVEIRTLAGSGDYTDTLARSDGKPGAQIHASQHFDWAIAPNSRPRILKLPRQGATTISVPLRVHLVSTGGGTYFDGVASPPRDVTYTCHADTTYRTRASLRAKARDDGWSLRLRSIKRLKPGTPECTDEYAEDYFSWGTGGSWFTRESVALESLPRAQARRATIDFANDPPSHDCTEVPGVTPTCTQELAWTATLQTTSP